jgi:perosamine synthetase
MIAVQDPELAARLRFLRQHAMDVSDLARHAADDVVIERYPEPGWNFRMTDMQAALGLCQLELLDEILDRRRRLAERYTAALEELPALHAPYEPSDRERTWQSYCVRVDPSCPVGRTDIMRSLLADGIATRRGVMAIHEEDSYAAQGPFDLPHTEAAADVLMLPLYAGLTDDEQDFVIERLAAVVGAPRESLVAG